jgi:hypothetical protein
LNRFEVLPSLELRRLTVRDSRYVPRKHAGSMQDPAIDECFRLLKLRRGSDFITVKQAYRRNLQKCHPDRFQNRADLLPVAERKTKRLVQVYEVLERWYQSNGGIDPVSPSPSDIPVEDFADDWAEEPAPPPFSRKVGIGLAAAVVVTVLAAFAWWFTSEAPPRVSPISPKTSGSVVTPAVQAGQMALPAAHPPAPETVTTALTAMVAEGERVKAAWIQNYMQVGDAGKRAAEMELAAAQAQFDSAVRDRASEIRDAEAETARQADQWRKDSVFEQQRFEAQKQASLETLKADYDAWLLARGEEAVAAIKALRKRENSEVGVFSDTEDPRNIFEFWTAEEAGDPEINIAAKTGVEVRQPDERFFPHFRSNIFLYNPEGQTLVGMMESIVDRHGALERGLKERKLSDEAELANWATSHPEGPPRLSSAQQSAIEGRDRATARLSAAQGRLAGAALALSPSAASKAFEQSPIGQRWAERISAMRKNPADANGPQ